MVATATRPEGPFEVVTPRAAIASAGGGDFAVMVDEGADCAHGQCGAYIACVRACLLACLRAYLLAGVRACVRACAYGCACVRACVRVVGTGGCGCMMPGAR